MSWQNSLTFPDLRIVVYIQMKQFEDYMSSSTSTQNISAKFVAWPVSWTLAPRLTPGGAVKLAGSVQLTSNGWKMLATLLLIFFILHFVAQHSIPLPVTGHQGTGRARHALVPPGPPACRRREMWDMLLSIERNEQHMFCRIFWTSRCI